MRGHAEARRAVGLAHLEDVEDGVEAHARAEVGRPPPFAEGVRPLHVAPLAHVDLALGRELARIDDRVVDLLRDVHDLAGPLRLDVDGARAVAPLAVDPEGDVVELVLRALDEAGHGVVAGHARLIDGAAEPAVPVVPKARREVPPLVLDVPRHGDLVDVPVHLAHVGVRVVAGADDEVDLIDALVDGVAAGEAVLHDEEVLAAVEGEVVEVVLSVVDRLGVLEVGVAVAQRGRPERAAHLGLHEGRVLRGVAGAAGLGPHVGRLGAEVEVGGFRGGWGRRIRLAPARAEHEGGEQHQTERKGGIHSRWAESSLRYGIAALNSTTRSHEAEAGPYKKAK